VGASLSICFLPFLFLQALADILEQGFQGLELLQRFWLAEAYGPTLAVQALILSFFAEGFTLGQAAHMLEVDEDKARHCVQVSGARVCMCV
jgi:hypothetical protein